MTWVEGTLLNILEVVLGVTVENESSELLQREVCVRPYFSHVEDVPFVFVTVCFWHDLNMTTPCSRVALLNMFE